MKNIEESLQKNTNKMMTVFNQLIASYHIYYQNLRNFHWNVEGENFYTLHELFEHQYNKAKTNIDDIVERQITIGVQPLSKMSDYLKQSKIVEANVGLTDRQMMNTLYDNQTALMALLNNCIEWAKDNDDEATIDLLGSILSDMEIDNWQFGAWLGISNLKKNTSKPNLKPRHKDQPKEKAFENSNRA